MKVYYADVAPAVVSKTELLTEMISDASRVIAAATRMLELEQNIRVVDATRENSQYNVSRTLMKRVAALQQDIQALGLEPERTSDPRLVKAYKAAQIDKLVKLQKWHPDTKKVLTKMDPMFVPEQLNSNPYHEANTEDFDDE